MGTILAEGLVRAGWDPADLVLAVRRKERAVEAERLTGITTLLDPAAAAAGREVVVVAVKPKDVGSLLRQIANTVTSDQLVISLAAGVPISVFEAVLPGVPVVRSMPNTPAAVDEAMTAYCGGAHTDEASLERAAEVLAAVGDTINLSEDLLDAVTAVSGTGPAYIFLLAESLTEAAIREGLPIMPRSASSTRRCGAPACCSKARRRARSGCGPRSPRRVEPRRLQCMYSRTGVFGRWSRTRSGPLRNVPMSWGPSRPKRPARKAERDVDTGSHRVGNHRATARSQGLYRYPPRARPVDPLCCGETMDDAVAAAQGLNQLGARVSLDHLGEHVTDTTQAESARDDYLACLDRIGVEGIDGNISVKLTQLGLGTNDGLAAESLGALAAHAREVGTSVSVDMEESALTEATVTMFEQVQANHGNLGLAVQAYLRRTPTTSIGSLRPGVMCGSARAPMPNRRTWPTRAGLRSTPPSTG